MKTKILLLFCLSWQHLIVSQLASVTIKTFFSLQGCSAFHAENKQRETTQLFPSAAGMTFVSAARSLEIATTKQFFCHASFFSQLLV